jgi:hypothetical protein
MATKTTEVKANTKKEDATSIPAPTDKEPQKPASRTKTILGCIEGTQSGFLDNLFLKGSTPEQATAAISKEFKMDEPKAKARVKSHLKHFESKEHIVVTTDKKGVITAKLKK